MSNRFILNFLVDPITNDYILYSGYYLYIWVDELFITHRCLLTAMWCII